MTKLPNDRTVCENKEEIQKEEKHLNLYNIKKIELHVDDSIKLSTKIKEASKVCGRSSRTKGLRKRRIITKSMHEGLWYYTCNKCDHKSLHKENITLHMQASHDNIRYPCDQCDFKAARKGNL